MWIIIPIPKIISLDSKTFIKGKRLQTHIHIQSRLTQIPISLQKEVLLSKTSADCLRFLHFYILSGNNGLFHRFGAPDTFLCSLLNPSFST